MLCRTGMLMLVLVVSLLLFGINTISFARTIDFAGLKWSVKTGIGGPGPNNWSNDEQSVWVDSEGLHLKIRKVGNTWYCAEIVSVLPTEYGMHQFYVVSRVDQLDMNVVAATFLYIDDNHEIDIEFSKWKNSWPGADNAIFVVQNNSGSGSDSHSYGISLNGDYSTHYIDWSNGSVTFKSFHGHYTEPPDAGFLIEDWTYDGSYIPSESDGLHVHINLWLIDGTPPSDEQEVEFVVKNSVLPLSVAVDEVDFPELPTEFALLQNYPNPFNPKTEIKFALPTASQVRLDIFNIAGQKVAVLVDGTLSVGEHTVMWDGSSVATGIYLYRLTTPDFIETKKMVLLK